MDNDLSKNPEKGDDEKVSGDNQKIVDTSGEKKLSVTESEEAEIVKELEPQDEPKASELVEVDRNQGADKEEGPIEKEEDKALDAPELEAVSDESSEAADNNICVKDTKDSAKIVDSEELEIKNPTKTEAIECSEESKEIEASSLSESKNPSESNTLELKEDKDPSDDDGDDDENETREEIDAVDHDTLTREQLVIRLNHLLESIPVSSRNLKGEVEAIKMAFKIKLDKEREGIREKFLLEGGEEKDFKFPADAQEQLLNELVSGFKRKRYGLMKTIEAEKKINLLAKRDVISGIKDLIQSEESIFTTFNNFKDLQKRWREIGSVPQANVSNLYENYHHAVEMFYDYIKINKELRDLDLKKNQEAKEQLCLQAEALVKEENAVNAFNKLQELHKEWREIGPVAKEFKELLWERFKASTSQVNKNHQKYYDDLKQEQKDNLDKKVALCEKVEGIAELVYDRPKTWNKKSDEIIAIQNEWRNIGFAPRKFNNKIYERFRKACDKFFDQKRSFYDDYRKDQDDNLKQKQALVEQAEALKDSEDWKRASQEFVKIQKQWKAIGPVPRKYSDIIWNEFRTACDCFFDRKKLYFKDIHKVQDENLRLKKLLIDEINAFEAGEDDQVILDQLNDFKAKWNAIGHVPFKDKDSSYNEFRNALNRHYDKLHMDESKREMQKYRSKLDDIQGAYNSDDKLYSERTKLLNKIRSMENDIAVWENNIGFFSQSNKAGGLLKEYEIKISKAKEHLAVLKEKVDLLNDVI